MTRFQQFIHSRTFRAGLFLLLLFTGAFMRFYALGQVPRGVNCDEAMSAYQAFTLLRSGTDLNGYCNPVYFVAWGGGQSILQSWLMVPCIRAFGLTEFAIRLPQAVIGTLCLPVFFLLLRRIFDKPTAWIGYALLAISPWHIMMSRWALDCNFAAAFLLFGLFFFLLGLERHPGFFLLSAVFYGLSLYSYATVWVVLPILLILQFVCLIWTKKIRIRAYTLGFAGILLLAALPLVLFIAVNQGWIPEIRSAVLSIPHMPEYRSSVFTTEGLFNLQSFYRLFQLLVTQSDGYLYNSFPQFGLFYLFSLPFIVYGVLCSIKSVFSALRNRMFSAEALIHSQLLAGLSVCLLIDIVNINRSNFLYLPLIAFLALGLRQLLYLRKKTVFQAVAIAYAASFLAFAGYYFGDGRKELADHYRPGTREALVFANEQSDDTIVCRTESGYVKVLYYLAIPVEDYRSIAVFPDTSNKIPTTFGKFQFENPGEAQLQGDVYVLQDEDAQAYLDAGYTVEIFDRMAVAYLPDETGE
ncbi:MAG: glycosyltransferase family 39 protein [Eubacteriales bacterium]|nr:glycosyltransferase family 39 protein [Eubacteriales bacterium]